MHDVGRRNQLSFDEFKLIFFEDTTQDVKRVVAPADFGDEFL